MVAATIGEAVSKDSVGIFGNVFCLFKSDVRECFTVNGTMLVIGCECHPGLAQKIGLGNAIHKVCRRVFKL